MSSRINQIILEDLATITRLAQNDLQEVVNSHVVLTGASGFIGKWLTLSYLHARKEFHGIGKIVLCSRNSEPLRQLLHEAQFAEGYEFVESDVRNFPDGIIQDRTLLIHAATPARESLNLGNPMEMFDIILNGQRRLLELSSQKESVRFLFLSSGAVYGQQPLDLEGLPEEWTGAPDISAPTNSYHEGKRVAELMGNIFAVNSSLEFISARLFAFLAPFLPLDEHFAAGNFIRDASEGKQITIKSGGGSIRSYQYATDLCISLWALVMRGPNGQAFNVGSEEPVTILEFAKMIADIAQTGQNVKVLGIDTEDNVNRYVPSTEKIRNGLSVRVQTHHVDAIQRTLNWLQIS